MGTLIIAGTTASGKTSLAVDLAKAHDAVVVSADAMTIFRGLDIGTAKPTVAERCGVEHFGIDTHHLKDDSDVSGFVDLVDRVRKTHPRIIIAGGTTFWVSALVRPLAALPPSNPALRAELEAVADPYAALTEVDPSAAERLHPNDRVRVVRALEVFHLTGQTQSSLHAAGPKREPLSVPTIWLDSDDLRPRIDERIRLMVEGGYIDEAQWACREDPDKTCRALQSFAYKHLVSQHDGLIDTDEALRRTARDTWQYARKQRNWAKNLGWTQSSQDDIKKAAEMAFELG